MRPEEFSDPNRRHLVRIAEGWAFLPPPLPAALEVTPAILRAADAARGAVSELTGSVRAGAGFDELAALLFRPIAVNEAVSSARIEGIHTQVVDLVIREVAPTAARRGASPEYDERLQEAANAAATVQLGFEWIKEGRTFSSSMLKDLHARILQSSRGEERNPGALRTRQVWLGSDDSSFDQAAYVPPPPEHIPPLLDNLALYLAGEIQLGALVDAAVSHYQFEAIHPFEDGNGRLGRALISLFLIFHGVLDRPWLGLSSAFEAQRDEYLERLKAVSTQGAWGEWVLFFLHATTAQAEDSARRVRRAFELREAYRRLTAASVSAVPARALDHVLERVFVSVNDLAVHTSSSYPTARFAIDELVRMKILEPWGKLGARQHWVAREFLSDVYESRFSHQRP